MYHSGNQLLDPYLIFEKARLQSGMHVADFGCGRTGHIVFPAARILGEQGVIYAVDILKDVLENINKRAKMEAFVNIHTIWSDLEMIGKTAVPKESLDVVFVINTLVQSHNRHAVLEEAKRLLKEKGRIIVVDWYKKGVAIAPSGERYVDFENVKQWGRSRGFVIQEEFAVGPYHYGVVLFRG